MTKKTLFEQAIEMMDAANAADPNKINVSNAEHPKELIHAKWLSEKVKELAPDGSEALHLAARCQHICRWESPRSDYPMNRPGYLKWRAELKKLHAEKAGQILREVGYDDKTIERVQSLNLKKDLKKDPECQVIEDALCLVFLEHQFEAFSEGKDKEKIISILQKTWKKMSEQGHTHALELNLSDKTQALIQEALS